MSNLAQRLRAYDGFEGGHSDAAEGNAYELIAEAADRIEELEAALKQERAQTAKLRRIMATPTGDA